ncbi:M1 family aminopeptidase [Gordoniibacillus kamchatkensis]|uniref:M1 family aminopeptidase n=1 Tax=Gordoniibacillus kamchatkensis TaxID=1590651 RepID=UPI000698D7FC|nr:M1 family aminopeptidase [Paenibacillus sp. VKM B-2647]
MVRHHFRADDVHDFAWAASPDFIFSEEQGSPGAKIKLYLDPKHAHLKDRYVRTSTAALTAYEEWYGKYPYSSLSIVVPPEAGKPAGSMEYPTFVTVAAASEEKPNHYLELVLAHEIAHQYWYGMVANNEFEEAWLDESFATYADEKFLHKQLGLDTKPFYRPYSPAYNRLAEYSWRYKNRADYVNNVYIGGKHVLEDIEQQIGSGKMQEVMKAYFETWKFRHPGTKDFMDVLEKETGRSWQDYFNSHVYGKT